MQIQAIPLPELSMECEVHCESPNTPASSMEDIASVVSSASPTKEASSPFDPVKAAAEFVLSLRQGHNISQKCIERVIERTDLLLKSTVAAVQ